MENFWKRKARPNKAREPQISNPILHESTLDNDVLQGYPDIVNSRASARSPDEAASQLAPLPFKSMNSAPKERIVSHAPTVSSIYSRGPSDWKEPNKRAPVSSPPYEEVSPPDSPNPYEIGRAYGSGDVSPIEPPSDIHPAFRVQKSPTTQIPVFRKVTPTSSSPIGNSTETRWDKYSGEPTQGPTGLASQVKPGSALPILTSRKPLDTKSNLAALDKSQLRSVTERAANLTKGLAIDTRPAWKGASGRTALVAPVADKVDRTMPQPQRDTNKKQAALPSPPPSSSPTYVRRGIAHEAETTHAPSRKSSLQAYETSKPIPSTKFGQGNSRGVVRSTESPTYGPDSYPSPVSIHDQPAESHHQPVKPPNTISRRNPDGREESPPPKSTNSTPPKSRPSTEYSPSQQQNSRFSWTTLATNTSYQRSPPPSPPPMPTTFAVGNPTPAPVGGGLVMSRTRPIPSSRNEPPPAEIIKTSFRRPVGASSRADPNDLARGTFPARASSRALSLSSTTTVNAPKALPPTPQEVNSQDHIGSLQAQVEDLATQRANVQRVLRDLLKPEASNPLLTNFRAEREREKRVQGLKDELNEIALAEHDIGLKLHRAYKKREREEGREGTALWIKRIAN